MQIIQKKLADIVPYAKNTKRVKKRKAKGEHECLKE